MPTAKDRLECIRIWTEILNCKSPIISDYTIALIKTTIECLKESKQNISFQDKLN